MIEEGRPYPVLYREQHQIGRLTVIKDTILTNGHEHPFTYVEYGDSVCILAIYRGKVAVIEQYRHTLNSWDLELPCGGVEKGEAAQEAAARELREETGLQADKLTFLGSYYTNQGYSSCSCSIYFTECQELRSPSREETELIRLHMIPVKDFDAMVRSGDFRLLIGVVAWERAKINGLVEGEKSL